MDFPLGSLVYAPFQEEYYIGIILLNKNNQYVVVFPEDGLTVTVNKDTVYAFVDHDQDNLPFYIAEIPNLDLGIFLSRFHTNEERRGVGIHVMRLNERTKSKLALPNSDIILRGLQAFKVFKLTRRANTPIYHADEIASALDILRREIEHEIPAKMNEAAAYIDKLTDKNIKLEARLQSIQREAEMSDDSDSD